MLGDFKKFIAKEKQPIDPKPITEREMFGMQYLGGYVIQNIFKKVCNLKCKTDLKKKEQIKSLVLACKCEDEINIQDQKLIQILNRGGLWAIKKELQYIFIHTETLFRKTATVKIVNINIYMIINNLFQNVDVMERINYLSDECPMKLDDSSIKVETFHMIIELYLKVRCHSYAKDIMTEIRIKNKNDKREKGLRKLLKEKDSVL